jgi:inhibitor of cysteine peptidase
MKFPLALIACLLAGCATNSSTRVLTPLDNGHEVTVTVGQVLVVELPSNRTTGYEWNYRIVGGVFEQVGQREFMEDAHPFGMVGVGGTEIWRFRAVKGGRQTLRLDYVRPWEKDVAPVKTVSFNVVVEP